MKTTLSAFVAFGALAGAALASTETFDFKDPKNGNNVVFKLVAPRETIQGSASASGAGSMLPAMSAPSAPMSGAAPGRAPIARMGR